MKDKMLRLDGSCISVPSLRFLGFWTQILFQGLNDLDP